MEPVPNTDPWIISLVRDFLSESGDRICIFEDWSARSSDPFWSKNEERRDAATFVDNEVYYVLISGDSEECIQEAVRWSGGAWPGRLGAMTSTAEDYPIQPDTRNISRTHRKILAERTERLAVGAYDGESYLVWTKGKA